MRNPGWAFADCHLLIHAYTRENLLLDLELGGKLYLCDKLEGEISVPKENHILFVHMWNIHLIFKGHICSVGLLCQVLRFRSKSRMKLISTQLSKCTRCCHLLNNINWHVDIQIPSLKPLPAAVSLCLGMVCVSECSLIQSLWEGGVGWLFEGGDLEPVQSSQVTLLLHCFLLWEITLLPKWHLNTWVTKFSCEYRNVDLLGSGVRQGGEFDKHVMSPW